MKRLMLVCVMILCLLPMGGWAEENADALYPIRENGLWGYMNRAGEVVIEPQWRFAEPFSAETAVVHLGGNRQERSSTELYCDGLIDRHGSYLIEPTSGRMITDYPCACSIHDQRTLSEGFFDKASGYCLLPDHGYIDIDLTVDDGSGPIAVRSRDGMVGYVDRTSGETVIPFRYSGESPDEGFHGGYARPADEVVYLNAAGEEVGMGMRLYLIDLAGNEVILPDGMEPASIVQDGMVVYWTWLDDAEAADWYDDQPAYSPVDEDAEDRIAAVAYTGKDQVEPYEEYEQGTWGYGLARIDGTIIVEALPNIDIMELPDESGIICYSVIKEESGGWGHMDMEGHILVPPRYNLQMEEDTYHFLNRFAVFKDYSEYPRWVILDQAGHERYTAPIKPEDGTYLELGDVMANGLFWYTLHQYEWVTTGNYRHQEENSRACKLMRITDDGVESLTETVFEDEGCYILVADLWDDIPDFSEGLHPVKQNGLWGYINEQAEWVIPPQYDSAASFRDSLALVEKDGKLMYIDHGGAVVWEER